MSKSRKRAPTSYLFKPSDSRNWYIRLRSPDGRFEKSLGTSDKREAEIIAMRDYGDKIAEHKAKLLAARPRVEATWQHKLEPGRKHVGPDGTEIIATDRELIYLSPDGSIIRKEPNGHAAIRMVSPRLFGATTDVVVALPGTPSQGEADAFAASLAIGRGGKVTQARPTVAVKNGDDAIIETYLSHRSIAGQDRRTVETVWLDYKQLTNSKPLKDATRDDGRLLVQRFKDAGNKSRTITKKVGWLRSAVELAINEGKLRFNPFSNIVPKADDETERLPLDDADMKACRHKIDTLSEADRLLFRILATTGMRLSEAYQIDGESKENGVRYVIVGRKTEQSKRRVPLPADLLPLLPKTINGPLFAGDTDNVTVRRETQAASWRLNKFLNDCGIADPRKVIHSLRHRAQDRLRAAGAPQDIREALLGHSKVTVGEGYGVGFPVPMLKKWIDKIGL